MTKLIKIFFCFTLIVIFSCTNEENTSPIPEISINVLIPLQSYPLLQTIGNAVYFASFNGQSLGYRGHGIYIIKTESNIYRAFDATCSNNPDVTTHVELKTNGYECPTCNSFFELFTGSVVKNPASYPLKEYNAILSGQNIQVRN